MKIKNFAPRPFKFREVIPKIENNLQYLKRIDKGIYESGYHGAYWTFDFITFISDYIDFNEIKTIFDIGSRDALQALELQRFFSDSKIYKCYKNTEGTNIEIVPYACSDIDGEVTFGVSNANIGASSLLKNTQNGRAADWNQEEIKVQATRLDSFMRYNNIENVDMLWMDVQGAEKLVFDGLGKKLKNVKIINTECNLQHLYHGSIMADELDEYMKELGFTNLVTYYLDEPLTDEQIEARTDEVEIIYINNKYLNGEI